MHGFILRLLLCTNMMVPKEVKRITVCNRDKSFLFHLKYIFPVWMFHDTFKCRHLKVHVMLICDPRFEIES